MEHKGINFVCTECKSPLLNQDPEDAPVINGRRIGYCFICNQQTEQRVVDDVDDLRRVLKEYVAYSHLARKNVSI